MIYWFLQVIIILGHLYIICKLIRLLKTGIYLLKHKEIYKQTELHEKLLESVLYQKYYDNKYVKFIGFLVLFVYLCTELSEIFFVLNTNLYMHYKINWYSTSIIYCLSVMIFLKLLFVFLDGNLKFIKDDNFKFLKKRKFKKA